MLRRVAQEYDEIADRLNEDNGNPLLPRDRA
jgi:hypothetical protein